MNTLFAALKLSFLNGKAIYYNFWNLHDLLVKAEKEAWERDVTCLRLPGEVRTGFYGP